MISKTILVVDDDPDIVEIVGHNLGKEGFHILRAFDGETALKMIDDNKPDLVILDLLLPGRKGLDICRTIRKKAKTQMLPIIMTADEGNDADKIIGLEAGADDYLTKPFSIRELGARVRALLRRSETNFEGRRRAAFYYRGLSVDHQSYEVTLNGKKIDLGPTERKLLMLFTRQPGKVFSRRQILDYIWGKEAFIEQRTIDVHISRLRNALKKDKDHPEFIMTIRGIGYRFAHSRE